MPKYYIIYQTLNLSNNQLTSDYLNILSRSIAVWDFNQDNINRYSSTIRNYHYFPQDYKYADPVVLPCTLSTSMLEAYKKLLIYSNQYDTDISSHLPTLFCYTVSQDPQVIVEAGVRGGESTRPFEMALKFLNATLIGIDIEQSFGSAYSSIKNGVFVAMNDLDFAKYYKNSEFKDKKVDIVFIDTSHLYKHTLAEIKLFVPLLSDDGFISFHDSNVTPINGKGYIRLNGTMGGADGNTRGVTQAIKEYFSLEFDEHAYFNSIFNRGGVKWHIIHYPFCNGLTIIKKIKE